MTSSVSVSFGAEQLRLQSQQGHNLLGCEGETWITKVYTLTGTICRDKAIRLLFNENCRSDSPKPFYYFVYVSCIVVT